MLQECCQRAKMSKSAPRHSKPGFPMVWSSLLPHGKAYPNEYYEKYQCWVLDAKGNSLDPSPPSPPMPRSTLLYGRRSSRCGDQSQWKAKQNTMNGQDIKTSRHDMPQKARSVTPNAILGTSAPVRLRRLLETDMQFLVSCKSQYAVAKVASIQETG